MANVHNLQINPTKKNTKNAGKTHIDASHRLNNTVHFPSHLALLYVPETEMLWKFRWFGNAGESLTSLTNTA